MTDLIPRRHRALTIALVYAVVGAVWILVSDHIVDLMSPDLAVISQLQTWKGWAFVATSALLIYLLVRRALRAQGREEARRLQAEDLTRIVLDTIPGMILWKDRQSRYLGGNAVALREAGLSRSVELLGLTDADLPWKASAELLRQHDQEILSGRVARLDYEIVIETASGRQRDQSVTKLPLRDGTGAISGVLVYSEDLTERRQTERQLRHAQKLQVIGELTSGVTHDFKNVLSVIIANAEWIASSVSADETNIRNATADILAVSKNASEMVRKLLAFSRQETLSVVPIDISSKVRELTPTLGRMLSPAYRLDVHLGVEVPLALADGEALEQILLNVVANARDAMPEGGAITVEVVGPVSRAALLVSGGGARIVLSGETALLDAMYVGVTITDNGSGMPHEVAERIFEPYFTTRAGGAGTGTGLGLSMVHGLVHQLAGIMILRTAVDSGATFGFYFPVATVESASPTAPTPVAPTSPKPTSEASPKAPGKTILLVDDQPELLRVGVRVLRRLGYEVLEAPGGAEALEIFAREQARIDLILTDLMMPEMNGLELVAKIRGQGSEVLIALSSGDPNIADKVGATDYGTLPMIPKPWTMKDLGEGVQALLGDLPT